MRQLSPIRRQCPADRQPLRCARCSSFGSRTDTRLAADSRSDQGLGIRLRRAREEGTVIGERSLTLDGDDRTFIAAQDDGLRDLVAAIIESGREQLSSAAVELPTARLLRDIECDEELSFSEYSCVADHVVLGADGLIVTLDKRGFVAPQQDQLPVQVKHGSLIFALFSYIARLIACEGQPWLA